MLTENRLPCTAIGPFVRNCGTLPGIVFVAFICAFPSRVSAVDWHRWRGPDANGISKETDWSPTWPSEGPKQLWKANVGTGFSSVSVSHGRVYTVGNKDKQDTVYCFDADTGLVLWKHPYSAPLDAKYYQGGPSATPSVDGDHVYTSSKRGQVFCLDAATGKVVWSRDLAKELGAKVPTWGFASSPLVDGNLVILNLGSAGTALEKATAKVVWTSGKEEAGYSTPVPFSAGGERCVALFLAESVAAFRIKDGKEVWRQTWKTDYDVNAADPIIDGDNIFISSGYNRGAALLKILSGQPNVAWENKNMRNHFNSCVLIGGHLYGFDESELKCVEWLTGKVTWSEQSLGKGALMAADGKLIVLGEKGELVIVEAVAASFKPLSRAQVLGGLCWSTPVLSNGRIYCRNAKGDLVCLDASTKQTPHR
jgi:outer membrane protein assembly factor BamB